MGRIRSAGRSAHGPASRPPWGSALLAGVLAAVVLSGRVEGSGKPPDETLPPLQPGPQLVWSDPQELFPFGRDRLVAELAALFRGVGVDVELDLTGRERESTGPETYRINVMREPKPYWRLRSDVMAAAPRVEGSQGTIYVFLDQVRRVLGHFKSRELSELPREHAELAKALARILAHEVVHAVAPDHPHASSGLMVARFRRASLLRRQVRIDPGCARAFRRALGAGAVVDVAAD